MKKKIVEVTHSFIHLTDIQKMPTRFQQLLGTGDRTMNKKDTLKFHGADSSMRCDNK